MLELRGAAPGLLDEPLLLEVGGAAPGSTLIWRARIRDDDGFVWRGEGASLDALRWTAKADGVAALRSLRPVELEVRVEDADGTATRTLTRTVLDRGGEGAALEGGRDRAPAPRPPTPPRRCVVDGEEPHTLVAARAAGLARRARLRARRAATRRALPLRRTRAPARRRSRVPPGLPARDDAPDAAAWDALLADLGATPRRVAR